MQISSEIKQKFSNQIKEFAKQEGFSACGIAASEFLEEDAKRLELWLKKNNNASMSYMENNFDKRLDPAKLVEGTKSVISLAFNYFPVEEQKKEDNYIISKYAYGIDYHFVIKDKLRNIESKIKENIGDVMLRSFVDSAPIMEKTWAQKSGLGWIGKNSNLILPKKGSFFFLAEIFTDLELKYDEAFTENHCGSCNKCIEACPTNAITAPYTIDSSKCISYLTIEHKGEIDEKFKGLTGDRIFGCDICQDVCPWNKYSKPNNESLFKPNNKWINFKKNNWELMDKETFNTNFKNSALKRTKFSGINRNIDFAKSSK